MRERTRKSKQTRNIKKKSDKEQGLRMKGKEGKKKKKKRTERV